MIFLYLFLHLSSSHRHILLNQQIEFAELSGLDEKKQVGQSDGERGRERERERERKREREREGERERGREGGREKERESIYLRLRE